jgi:serine/threonine-protein kinase
MGMGALAAVGPNDATIGPVGMDSSAMFASGKLPPRIGRYDVITELGRGAMGVVYKARDPQIGRLVAIKMILTGSVPPQHLDAYKKRFFREAQTAGLLSHPGIVTIYDLGEHESGQDKILAPEFEGGEAERMPLQTTLDIIIQLCDALDCAHTRGVIHRDIKPANILYTTDGKAKLADFGIAKLEGSQLTQTGTIMGTPAFMSPEQFSGAAVDQRSDIFSLGAVLYLMVTGETPFPGNTITAVIFKLLHSDPVPARQLNTTLPTDIDAVLTRCLAKKAEDRYTTAMELAADLKAIRAGRSIEHREGAAGAGLGSASVGGGVV